MGFFFTIGALIALSVIAMRFGVDSREWTPTGWLVRRQPPARSRSLLPVPPAKNADGV